MKQTLTPAMRQYLEIKEQNKDAIIFFRMGDFYEMFFEDAKLAARVLGIALTARDRDREIPMCGVPYHAASSYIAKLVREGHKVAVCEQIEDPNDAKGIVQRAVAKVITPGIALEEELLDPKTNNFIASCYIDQKSCGFSYMDVSTGEFRLTELAGKTALLDEIKRLRPLELIVPADIQEELADTEFSVKKVTRLPRYDFDYQSCLEKLNRHFSTWTLDGFGCKDMLEATKAAGALLNYIKDTQRSELTHVKKCAPYYTDDFLILDYSTRRNLEVMQNMRTNEKDGSILSVLDRTKTAMGGRRLKSWLLHPLKDIVKIRTRQDAIEELIDNREVRAHIQELLAEMYDLERLIVRVTLGAAGPKDLAALKATLEKVPALKKVLKLFHSGLLSSLAFMIDEVEEAAQIIDEAIMDNPPFTIRDGGVIKDGYSKELDELRSIGSGGKDWIAKLEADERIRTGINSLKVGYNRVFGYYIEVTKSNLSGIPDDYIRKQTLVNAERFITPALKEWEEKILTSEEKSKSLEAAIFSEIIKKIATFADRVHKTADSVSTLDSLASLSQVSGEMNYVRPDVNEGTALIIEGGRHPVIEANAGDGFISNDLFLDNATDQIMILTGPNMAGKSTFLRQNAIIILMAQIGSFVPASRASVGLVDRIFTRVGASDDLSRGQSTFMVEMSETANILNNATPRSFIVLDEIGRGTSTFDGLSIAWAVVEFLHDESLVKAKTLFATHYHELTELSLTKERVKNYNMAVREWKDSIMFLRKVVPGGSSRSYGIQVARLAGLPAPVIERAKEILRNLETGELNDSGIPRIAVKTGPVKQMSLLGEKDPVREELKTIDPNSITPLDAMNLLHRLKEMLEN